MFFPKLRRRAKWVFLLLAVAFGGGFIFFGVGAGGSGIGDYFSDLFNRPIGDEGVSLAEAQQAVQERPNDPEARLELARAAQREGEVETAIAAYERYRTQVPDDEDALRSLAVLYAQQIGEAEQRATIAQNEATEATLPQSFTAEDETGFFRELRGNPISETIGSQAQARASAANSEAQRLLGLQLLVYESLVEVAGDENPLFHLQVAQAAEGLQDYEKAVASYEAFLEAAPNNPNAEAVEQRIESLKIFLGEIPQEDAEEGASGGGQGSGTTTESGDG